MMSLYRSTLRLKERRYELSIVPFNVVETYPKVKCQWQLIHTETTNTTSMLPIIDRPRLYRYMKT